MKKYLSILIFIFIFSGSIAFAESGACSWHGGVNCSAGKSFYGNAICNDGFESSTNYYLTDECKNDQSVCTLPSIKDCDADALLYTITSANPYAMANGGSGQQQIAECKNAHTQYQVQLASYKSCLLTQNAYVPPPVNDANTSCRNQFGQNSIVSPTKTGYCSCQSGYVFGNNDQCVSFDTSCQEKNGLNSKYDPTTKQCVDQIVLQTNQCKQSHGSNAEFSNGACSCTSGYKMNSQWQCTPLETRTIPSNVLDIAKHGSCHLFSNENEKSVCIDYQLHTNLYTWVISDKNTTEKSVAPSPKLPNIIDNPVVSMPKKSSVNRTESTNTLIMATTTNKDVSDTTGSTSIQVKTSNTIITKKVNFFVKIKNLFASFNPFKKFSK